MWEIKYTEECRDKAEALRREKEIKSKKSRKYLEKLIQKYLSEREGRDEIGKRCE